MRSLYSLVNLYQSNNINIPNIYRHKISISCVDELNIQTSLNEKDLWKKVKKFCLFWFYLINIFYYFRVARCMISKVYDSKKNESFFIKKYSII